MRSHHIFLSLAVVLIMLTACESSAKETDAALDQQSQNNHSTQNSNPDSTETVSNADDTDTTDINTEQNDTNEKVETSNNVSNKKAPSKTATNLKEEYLRKLNDTKKEMGNVSPADPSTYALKKVEDDRYDIWDELLNDVYGVLKNQLSTEEMDQLREKQHDWLTYRDETAKEASLKYEGGTHEHVEYVIVLANLTEERCYELVEEYM